MPTITDLIPSTRKPGRPSSPRNESAEATLVRRNINLIERLLDIAEDPDTPRGMVKDIYVELLPYVHPKRAAVQANGNAIPVMFNIALVQPAGELIRLT